MHIKLTNGNPKKYTIGQLRRDNPQVSFPKSIPNEVLAEFDVYPLSATEEPAYDPTTEKVVEVAPVKQGDVWVQVWDIAPLTPEETTQYIATLQRQITQQVQRRLDGFAETRNYDGIMSLCTYATSGNPKFRQEGQYGVEARDATWAKLYDILSEVEAENRPVPSGYAEIESELPPLVWPL
jgi:hypothetical protein